jgi:hypothetical protein
MHYSRFKAHGNPNAPGRRALGPVCDREACEGQPIAKGLCKGHYYEAWRAENPEKLKAAEERRRERLGLGAMPRSVS